VNEVQIRAARDARRGGKNRVGDAYLTMIAELRAAGCIRRLMTRAVTA
jgi:hypothetical protein